MENNNKICFKDVPVGDIFHNGISNNAGIHSDVKMYMVYRKVSKIQAICIKQIGYFNTRAINNYYSFSPYSIVYKFYR